MEIIHCVIRNYWSTLRFMSKFAVFRDVDEFLANKRLTSFNLLVANLLQCREVCFPVTGDTNKFKIVVETYWVHHFVFNCKWMKCFCPNVVNKGANRISFEIQHTIIDKAVKRLNDTIFIEKYITKFEVFFFRCSITIHHISKLTFDVLNSVDCILVFVHSVSDYFCFFVIQKHNASFYSAPPQLIGNHFSTSSL